MSPWQHLIQLRFELHILRQNVDVYALRSVYPGKVTTRRNITGMLCYIKMIIMLMYNKKWIHGIWARSILRSVSIVLPAIQKFGLSIFDVIKRSGSYQFAECASDNHLISDVPLICQLVRMCIGVASQSNGIIDGYSARIQSTFDNGNHHFWRIFHLRTKQKRAEFVLSLRSKFHK